MSQTNLIPLQNNNQKNKTRNSKRIYKLFFVKKLNLKQYKYSDNLINKEIDQYFNSPEKYFDINSPISINKKITLSKIDIINKIIPKDLNKGKEKNAQKQTD